MSLVPGLMAACLHPAPATFAVGFSLALVFWLVSAEEAELRRARVPRQQPARPAAAGGELLTSSGGI